MQDEKLTLKKAVKEAKSSELVKQHHEMLTTDGGEISFVRSKKRKPPKNKNKPSEKPTNSNSEQSKNGRNAKHPPKCYRCANSPPHKQEECPASEATCPKCKKIGHYATQCQTKNVRSIEEEDSEISSLDDYFLGSIESDEKQRKWSVELMLGYTPVKFKIDTGADVTVISEEIYQRSGLEKLRKATKKLFGPSQAKLCVTGVVTGNLMTGNGKQTRQDIYVVANLKEPLLEKPAIEGLNLIQKVASIQSDSSYNGIEAEAKANHPRLFKGLGELKDEFKITLKPDLTPFALTTPHRVALPLMSKVKAQLERMENLGVISEVDVPTDWCAGTVVVPKPDGKIRICVDLTKLNESVLRETYPLPKIKNMLAQIKESKYLTKLDCNSGFWQEKLEPDSRLLTTFITPFGRFCFNCMPFGIKSAPEHYQRKMIQILEGLDGHISIIDDMLIHGKTQKEHDERVRAVLKKLNEAGATLNPEKCEFSKREVKFAGHLMSEDGIKSDPEKIESFQGMTSPQNVGDVRRFLGMVNQLGRFIPHLAEKTKPLRDLLSKNQFHWGQAQQESFNKLKDELVSIPVLAYYDPQKTTILSADASSFGLGTVLLQEQDNKEKKPVAYASRSMTSTEQRYAQIEK